MKELAAVYGRVSTHQQEQEATIDSQVSAIETYAQAEGYQLVREYYFLDQAVSGAQLARPALDRLRDLAGEGQIGVVLCLSPDRLARKYAHQWVLLDEFQRAGVQVVFVNQPHLNEDPQSKFFLGMQGVFAEYDRAMITERLRRGKLYRIRQGQLVSPNPPYGYRYIPVSQSGGGRWEAHPLEAEIVSRIFQWYTEGRGLTVGAIVERLNCESLGLARGKRWNYSTVQLILKQPAYTGRGYYNRSQTCQEAIGRPKKQGRGVRRSAIHAPRPREEWIAVAVPTLVPVEVWQKAQEQLAMKQKFAQRNNKQHFYLLRSLLVCDVCGRTLVGRYASGCTTYYCSSRGKNRYPDVPVHCRSIVGSLVEPLIWQAVCELLRNPRLLEDAWLNQTTAKASHPEEIDRLQARLKAIDRQWERLLDLYQEEAIEKDELSQRKERLDRERENVQLRLQQLSRLARQDQVKQQMLDDFTAFCQRIEASLVDPSPELQQEVIRLLVDHVVVGENEIVIKHIVPTDDDCRLLPGRR